MLKLREMWRDELPRRALLVLLGLAFALRVVLVLRGGQLYFPDEGTHLNESLSFVSRLARGDAGGALDMLVETKAHPVFLLLGSLPTVVQFVLQSSFGLSPRATLWIPALMLSLMSVCCIALTAAIVRRAGGPEREALIAAVLMASATSLLYFSRHLVPYDLALALALFALWTGLDVQPSFTRSLVCGVLAGLAFFAYYGYLPIAAIAGLIHVLWGKRNILEIVKRGSAFALGFVLLPLLLTIASIARGATPFVLEMAHFTESVNQGTFSEGALLPWAYLWETERGVLLVWAAGALAIIGLAARRRELALSRGALWLAVAVGAYLPLAIGSTGLERFVVYGRLARQMVPFFCLATAFVLDHLADQWQVKRQWVWLGAILLTAQVVFNFWPPLTQQFPVDFERHVAETYGPVGRALTVKGPPVFGYDASKSFRYVLLNGQYLYPISGTRTPPKGEIVLQAAHPLEFLPYQYEGLDPEERAMVRSVDLSMRVIDTQSAK